jgi:hypothetical protein
MRVASATARTNNGVLPRARMPSGAVSCRLTENPFPHVYVRVRNFGQVSTITPLPMQQTSRRKNLQKVGKELGNVRRESWRFWILLSGKSPTESMI